jgi:hypothetical protein
MAKKKKLDKFKKPSLQTLRSRFEERVLTSIGLTDDPASWVLVKTPEGIYTTPSIQERWLGFLLAHDKGANAEALREPTPIIQRMVESMRAVARERLESAPCDSLAVTLDEWANRIEARPDGIYEDVYEQIVDMIDPQVQHCGPHDTSPFPASVVGTVSILLDHWNATSQLREVPPAGGVRLLPAQSTRTDVLPAPLLPGNVGLSVVEAACQVVFEALQNTEVHPCDIHDEAVRARKLYGPTRALYDALKLAGIALPSLS